MVSLSLSLSCVVFQELKLILAPVMPVRVALYVVFALDLVILEKSFVQSFDQAAGKGSLGHFT